MTIPKQSQKRTQYLKNREHVFFSNCDFLKGRHVIYEVRKLWIELSNYFLPCIKKKAVHFVKLGFLRPPIDFLWCVCVKFIGHEIMDSIDCQTNG